MVNSNLPGSLRPFRWDDLEALADLYSACAEFDDTGEFRTPDSLRTMLSLPGRNAEETIFVLPAADGIGFAAQCGAWFLKGVESDTVSIEVHIRPEHRSAELYTQLLEVAEDSGVRTCSASDRPTEFHVGVFKTHNILKPTLEHKGYQPARWFIDMLRDLQKPIPDVLVPVGIEILPFDQARDAKPLKLALDESFLDHWNTLDFTEEQFMHWVTSPTFRPDLTLVAYGPNGDPAAGCVGMVRDAYNTQTGASEGHVNILGVRRAYRQKGLAKALLAETFRRQKDIGMTAVSLEVDADNPTGAMGLYSFMGFEERRRTVVYAKPLEG